MNTEVRKLKKRLSQGVISEKEYYYKRQDIALHVMKPERRERYFELVHKTKISNRVSQTEAVAERFGKVLISAIVGSDNVLIAVVTFGAVILYWDHRIEYVLLIAKSSDQKKSVDQAIWESELYAEAQLVGAQLLTFYDPELINSL